MASITLPSNNPVTQVFYFAIDNTQDLTDGPKASSTWSKAIDILEQHPGFQRCYWGRSPEVPEKVQLHIGESRLFTA